MRLSDHNKISPELKIKPEDVTLDTLSDVFDFKILAQALNKQIDEKTMCVALMLSCQMYAA